MNLVCDELRIKNAAGLSELSVPTRLKLRQLYTELAVNLPGDPAPPQYLHLLGFSIDQPGPKSQGTNLPFPMSRSAKPQ